MAGMTYDINELAQRTFEINQANGYNEYQEELDRSQKAANKHLGNKGLLVNSEITEGQDELRKGKLPWEVYFVDGKPEGFLVEEVDAIIRILGDMSEIFEAHSDKLQEWTIGDLIQLKLEYNARRKDTATSGIKAF